jgi:hypothetical protein
LLLGANKHQRNQSLLPNSIRLYHGFGRSLACSRPESTSPGIAVVSMYDRYAYQLIKAVRGLSNLKRLSRFSEGRDTAIGPILRPILWGLLDSGCLPSLSLKLLVTDNDMPNPPDECIADFYSVASALSGGFLG